MIKGQLISSQRYLDRKKVVDKALRFKLFRVSVYPVVLRGVQYTVLMDGHHNFAAAKLAEVEPVYIGPPKKLVKIFSKMTEREIEVMLINNLTDCDYYFVDSGEVVDHLLMPEYQTCN